MPLSTFAKRHRTGYLPAAHHNCPGEICHPARARSLCCLHSTQGLQLNQAMTISGSYTSPRCFLPLSLVHLDQQTLVWPGARHALWGDFGAPEFDDFSNNCSATIGAQLAGNHTYRVLIKLHDLNHWTNPPLSLGCGVPS